MLSWVQRSRGLSVQGVMLSVLLISVVGCATQGRPASQARTRVQHRLETIGIVHKTAEDASPTSLDGIYNAAVVNSAVFRAKHQVELSPVQIDTQDTPMVSFISCDGCPDPAKCSSKCSLSPGSQVAPSDIWVSRTDQVLDFCKSLPSSLTAAEVILKIQQLQGLPPQVNSDPCTWQILQLSVGELQVPSQFFRPCPNPDPRTQGPCPADFDSSNTSATVSFQAWMAGQAFSSWQIPGGYPWTHLGYTYNWDPQASSIVGTSEYVITQGSPVHVVGLVPALPYCTQYWQNGGLQCPQ